MCMGQPWNHYKTKLINVKVGTLEKRFKNLILNKYLLSKPNLENVSFFGNDDDKTIVINDDDSNYKIRSSGDTGLTLLELNFEYGFYFTFHQSFTILENNINRNVFITDLNNALNNLYNNKQFTIIIDSNDNIKEMMEEISSKLDILTEKFLNKNFCQIVMNDLFRKSVLHFRSIVNPYRNIVEYEYNESDYESTDDSDDFVKED